MFFGVFATLSALASLMNTSLSYNYNSYTAFKKATTINQSFDDFNSNGKIDGTLNSTSITYTSIANTNEFTPMTENNGEQNFYWTDTYYSYSSGGIGGGSASSASRLYWYFEVNEDNNEYISLVVKTKRFLNETFNLRTLFVFEIHNYNTTLEYTYAYDIDWSQEAYINYTFKDNTLVNSLQNGLWDDDQTYYKLTITHIPMTEEQYINGSTNNYNLGYEDGYNNGYQSGYSDGFTEADNLDTTALTIFNGIITVGLLPVNFFLAIFNFEVFGINIGAFVSALLTIAIIVIVVRMVVNGGNKGD